MRWITLLVLVFVCFTLTEGALATNALYYQSYKRVNGAPLTTTLTEPAYSFSAPVPFSKGNFVNITVKNVSAGGFLDEAGIDFRGPGNTLPAVGTYFFSGRAELFQADAELTWDLNHGDFDGTGEFTIYEVAFAPSGAVSKFAGDFVMAVSGGDPAEIEKASIRFNSDVPLTVPEPATLTLLALGVVGLAVMRRPC